MIAEIISIGTEITTGSILNTNTKFLSERLLELGIETYYHTSVDDCEDRLVDIVKIALSRSDLIVTTGGLGPTQDDLTKEVVSKALGLDLEQDLLMEEYITELFKSKSILMTENNLKQAMRPKSSKFIMNDIGTAPGISIEKDNKKIIMLPGPPKEMQLMFTNHVIPLIKGDISIIMRSINTMGIGESSLETLLIDLDLASEDIDITTFAKNDGVEIKIIGKGKDGNGLQEKIDKVVGKLDQELGEFIYGYDNIGIENYVVSLLSEKNYRMGLAESCTGGLIASKITSVPGASKVFDKGIISYSNESKIDELGVSKRVLEDHGAVSKETAYEMAKGLLERSGLDIVMSITGIAGPDKDGSEKPVGLIYICVMDKNTYEIMEYKMNGDRIGIQNKAANRALFEMRKFLLK